MREDIQTIESTAKELFELLGISVELQVSETEDKDILLNIEPYDYKGLLIGRRGENISAIRTFLQQAFYNKTGRWRYIKLTVGDWLKKQEEYLLPLVEKAVQKVRDTGQPQQFYNLTAEQRRIIHLAVSKMEGVVSESVGEGRERSLIIKLADASRSISEKS